MPDLHHLLLFMLAGWLLNLVPGPDVLYIVTNSLRSGARAGLVAGLGITAGCCVHAFAAALGLGSLLAASTQAFTVVKWIGAGYLVLIGVRALLSAPPPPDAGLQAALAARPRESLRQVFVGGFWTNALNPKVALFFLAFLPQFIAPDAEHKGAVFLALGLLFNVNSLPVNAGWALAAAWLARRDAVRRGMHWLDKAAGLLFVGFGVKLALAGEPGR
jgi:threonine/homoserine/homoserine lactone efflux protein